MKVFEKSKLKKEFEKLLLGWTIIGVVIFGILAFGAKEFHPATIITIICSYFSVLFYCGNILLYPLTDQTI